MCTLAIFGSSQESSVKKHAKKQGIDVLFHDGKMSQRTPKYRGIIRKADVVIVMTGELNHNSMRTTREIAKEFNKPIVYLKGGISKAFKEGLSEYEKIKNKCSFI
jgi:hypothetical protein